MRACHGRGRTRGFPRRSGYLFSRRCIGGTTSATGAKSISARARMHDLSRSISAGLLAPRGGEIAEDDERSAPRRDIRVPMLGGEEPSPRRGARESRAIGTAPQAASPADWHNLFNTFSARWGHRRRRGDAALTVGVTAGLRRGSAHVAACRRQFGCRQ